MEETNDKKGLVYAIVGVCTLIIAVVGSTYAFYAASAINNDISGTAGGGAAPTLTVTPVSTGATGNLIPLDMTTEALTNAALGWHPTTAGVYDGNGAINTTWNASDACIDKNGYSVCQIYSVTLKNNSGNNQSFNIGVTALSGSTTPNIEVVKMDSNISVTNASSIKPDGDTINTVGIADGVSIDAGATCDAYYIMVFIKNLDSAQTDSGTFSGTITATSTTGDTVKATF